MHRDTYGTCRKKKEKTKVVNNYVEEQRTWVWVGLEGMLLRVCISCGFYRSCSMLIDNVNKMEDSVCTVIYLFWCCCCCWTGGGVGVAGAGVGGWGGGGFCTLQLTGSGAVQY